MLSRRLTHLDLDPGSEPMPADARLAAELGEAGFSVAEGFLDPAEVARLARGLRAQWKDGRLRHAGIGRGPTFRIAPEIRDDRVRWLDPTTATHAERGYFERMEALRLALNQALYLGLFDFEAHLAVFPPGARYLAHLDRFASAPHRVVSTTLYLNDADWSDEDGGQLRLYVDGDAEGRTVEVLPRGGTLALFLSDRILHEVLPARRDRLSIAGWFTRRA